MRRNYFNTAILTLAMMFAGAIAAAAQSSPLRGVVLLRSADGKETPVADAQVDVYRTDLPGKYNAKTNKKGEFAFAGLPLVGTYVIAASAPNAAPDILPNIRVTADVENKIILNPGDGKRLTEAEAKQAAKGGRPAAGGGESAEEKKVREEYEKKKSEVEAKNKKIDEVNTLYKNSFTTGNTALSAGIEKAKTGNRAEAIAFYSAAIAAYNEPLKADAEHPAAPVVLRNRGTAQKSRAIAKYNDYVTAKPDDTGRSEFLQAARQDIKDALASYNQALALLASQTAEDAAAQANNANTKAGALADRADAYNLYFTKIKDDPTELTNQLETAYKALQEYAAAEIDPAKKNKARLDRAALVYETASLTFDGAMLNRALAEYQQVLTEMADNPDALMRSGLILFNIGALTNDKTKYQEAANFLKLFIDKAPAAAPYDQYKKEAQEVLENLKAQQNVKPEKAPAGRRKP
jgi:hypothetical protein